jgi:uncharacterized paraquat-inducible protein A
MQNRKDNDLCEICGVMDGLTVVDQKLVCYRCGKKLKKQLKKEKQDERERQ